MFKKIDKTKERFVTIKKSAGKGCAFKDYVRISSHNDWFGKPFTFKYDEEKIVFIHRGIDWVGKVREIKCHNGSYGLEICDYLPHGTFFFDEEESNEDQIVIYFNKKDDEI